MTLRDFNLGSASRLWLSALIVAADQATKAIVRATVPLHDSVNVVPGLVDLTQVRNTGAAFGFLNNVDFPFKPAVMMLAASAALVGLAVYAASLPAEQRLTRFGLALILGGAVGNLIDRMVSGFVIDFVDVYWGEYHFWAFNVADSAITVGVCLMILELMGAARHASEAL